MLFPSFAFLVFLPVVYLLYWYAVNRDLRLQNLFILGASYVFYGWWDPRFLALLFGSSMADFLFAIAIDRASSSREKKGWLVFSLVSNLGLLALFKYFNFFRDGLEDLMQGIGMQPDLPTLHLILPIGISFYTFQSLSYTIDVYRRQLKASHDPLEFGAFVLFFPQLVAGPIERATNLLPQFATQRVFDIAKARDGLRQILWGLFKKVVVADNCAQLVNALYADPASQSGSTMVLATVLFAFQIYGDFSGYSDIAIGTARLFGFDLMRNFAFPYFSRDIAEFWRRWHISLSTWFRDYLYIPLGGSRGNKAFVVRNTMIIFIVSGFWHGANWTFLIWGALNALFFLPLVLLDRHRTMSGTVAHGRLLPNFGEARQMLLTFAMACFAWIFFRARDLDQAFTVIGRMLSGSLFEAPEVSSTLTLSISLFGILTVLVLEWIGRERQYGLQMDGRGTKPLRYALYYTLIIAIIVCAPLGGGEFIYFQF